MFNPAPPVAKLVCDFQSSRLFPTSAVSPKTAAREAGSWLRSAVQSGTAGAMAVSCLLLLRMRDVIRPAAVHGQHLSRDETRFR